MATARTPSPPIFTVDREVLGPSPDAGRGSSGSRSGGTVRRVAMSVPSSLLAVTGSPITQVGELVLTLPVRPANTVFAGPATGADAAPAFRVLALADIPDLSSLYQPLDSDLTAIAALATTAFGRGLLTEANAGSLRTTAGGTTVGQSFFTLANPSAVRFPRINADNTVSALSDADMRTALGVDPAGSGVTSIAGTANQVNASASTGAVTLSLPQSIHTGATPQFARLGLGAAADGTIPLLVSNGGAEGFEVYPGLTTNTTLLQAYNRSGEVYNTMRLDALDFSFRPSGSEMVKIDGSGNVGIGTASPGSTLHVAGPVRIQDYAVASLPSASSHTCAIVFVNDSSDGLAVVGDPPTAGGANYRAVYSNGSQWLLM